MKFLTNKISCLISKKNYFLLYWSTIVAIHFILLGIKNFFLFSPSNLDRHFFFFAYWHFWVIIVLHGFFYGWNLNPRTLLMFNLLWPPLKRSIVCGCSATVNSRFVHSLPFFDRQFYTFYNFNVGLFFNFYYNKNLVLIKNILKNRSFKMMLRLQLFI